MEEGEKPKEAKPSAQPQPVKENNEDSEFSINLKNMDPTKLLISLVTITLALTLINSYGIFIADSGGVTGGVINEGNNPSPPTPPAAPSVVEVDIGDAPIKGDPNAPVTLIEFSDYECPFCGRHYTQTYPQIIEEYVDTGKVKIVFKDFPLNFHPQAQKAAEAARCVDEQLGDEGYYEMHDKLFENQQALGIENYKTWARELGADGNEFDNCLDSGKMAGLVQQDLRQGSNSGVQGTPGFFINGKPLSGAQPFSAFKQAIDAEL